MDFYSPRIVLELNVNLFLLAFHLKMQYYLYIYINQLFLAHIIGHQLQTSKDARKMNVFTDEAYARIDYATFLFSYLGRFSRKLHFFFMPKGCVSC